MIGEYELVIVSHHTCYPVLTACSTTSNVELLNQLAEIVTELRKGKGVTYDLVICQKSNFGYTDESEAAIKSARKRLI